MAIAFFDLDRTLLAVNSGTLWVRRELRLGHITTASALRAMAWITRYQLGFASGELMVAQAVAHTAGTPAPPMKERTRTFFLEEVRHAYRPRALEVLERHRRQKDALVLLTSSSNYLSELVAEDLGFDSILCNTLEVDGAGVHTGKVVGRICFGEGKLVHARAEAEARGESLEASTFYTDSYSDSPVMEAVGFPVAVNPDPRLRQLALRRRWPVVDWGLPQRRTA